MRNDLLYLHRLLQLVVVTVLGLLSAPVWAGTWAAGSFDNDGAWDWVGENITATSSVASLYDAFKQVPEKGYIDVDFCDAAVAAAEITAALKTGKYQKLPKEIAAWAKRNRRGYQPALSTSALQALNICMDVKRSELAQLWQEANDKEWIMLMHELQSKLR